MHQNEPLLHNTCTIQFVSHVPVKSFLFITHIILDVVFVATYCNTVNVNMSKGSN